MGQNRWFESPKVSGVTALSSVQLFSLRTLLFSLRLLKHSLSKIPALSNFLPTMNCSVVGSSLEVFWLWYKKKLLLNHESTSTKLSSHGAQVEYTSVKQRTFSVCKILDFFLVLVRQCKYFFFNSSGLSASNKTFNGMTRFFHEGEIQHFPRKGSFLCMVFYLRSFQFTLCGFKDIFNQQIGSFMGHG